jgi:gamma-glutamylcyclotransferase
MRRLLYFAYGSNLWPPRLQARVASCNPVCRAVLVEYRLCFHKLGRDGSAKCDACFTGHQHHRVEGMVYSLLERERSALDRAEDLGRGYDAHQVEVQCEQGLLEALTYRARPEMIVPSVRPFSWYRQFVLQGALRHGLSETYIAKIRRQPVIADPDSRRAAKNHALLGRDPRPDDR